MPDDTAAIIDLVVDRQTMNWLYALGVIRADGEPEHDVPDWPQRRTGGEHGTDTDAGGD